MNAGIFTDSAMVKCPALNPKMPTTQLRSLQNSLETNTGSEINSFLGRENTRSPLCIIWLQSGRILPLCEFCSHLLSFHNSVLDHQKPHSVLQWIAGSLSYALKLEFLPWLLIRYSHYFEMGFTFTPVCFPRIEDYFWTYVPTVDCWMLGCLGCPSLLLLYYLDAMLLS